MNPFRRLRKNRPGPSDTTTTTPAVRVAAAALRTRRGVPVYDVHGTMLVRAMDLHAGFVLPDGSVVTSILVREGGEVDPSQPAVDRSAGRFCGVCDRHGSHHTDRHDEFMTAAITTQQGRDGAPVTQYVPGVDLIQVGLEATPVRQG